MNDCVLTFQMFYKIKHAYLIQPYLSYFWNIYQNICCIPGICRKINLCSLDLPSSLVGVVKGVITTIIGFFTFGGVPITFLIVAGIVLNTLGGAIYTFAKYQEKMTMEMDKHFVEHTVDVTGVTKANLRDAEEGKLWQRKLVMWLESTPFTNWIVVSKYDTKIW